MATSPGSFESTCVFNAKPSALPAKQRIRRREVIVTARNTWQSSGFSRWHQRSTLRPGAPTHESTKMLVPSVASSDEGLEKRVVFTPVPAITEIQSIVTPGTTKEEKTEELVKCDTLWPNVNEEDDTELDELDKLRRSISPFHSENEDFSEPASSMTASQNSLNEAGKSSPPNVSRSNSWADSLGRTSSTPLSQLRPSLSKIGFSGSEGPGWASSRTSCGDLRYKSSPLVVSGFCSSTTHPDLHSSSYHGSSDLQQASSSSAKRSTEPTQSFVEIWHDRLLQHWPVLPPISPQRGFSDSPSEVRSQVSRLSDEATDAFDELEGIIPFTGSSVSQCNTEDSRDNDCTSISEISQKAASLHLGCDSEEGSLAGVRLSLLDHLDWGIPEEEHETDLADLSEWAMSFKDPAGNTTESANDFKTVNYQVEEKEEALGLTQASIATVGIIALVIPAEAQLFHALLCALAHTAG
ncbi:hypothetical protein NDU88_004085 [Pleurodeles waltl]|uniref:Uncharacterized protein n=1 Tax=Pleurodeles waltl TaxID=8319 RepID=A0AAV7SHT9_PLEWA|nr:hypothetical protein NDU88_004085 [Pleurodeles waltl]